LKRAVVLGAATVLLAATVVITGFYSLIPLTPTGVTLNLKNQQLEVPTSQALAIIFGQPVELRLLVARLEVTPEADGDLASGGDGRRFTFVPVRAWSDATLYRVEIKPFHDLRGNPVGEHAWSFTTTIVPRVTTFLDDAGANLGPGSPIAQGGNVNLVFNTAMSQAETTVTANGQPAKLPGRPTASWRRSPPRACQWAA